MVMPINTGNGALDNNFLVRPGNNEVICCGYSQIREVPGMFEQQYDEQMTAEIRRLEGQQRAAAAGHPEWQNACPECGCQLEVQVDRCEHCAGK
jgi:hypothetical protein